MYTGQSVSFGISPFNRRTGISPILSGFVSSLSNRYAFILISGYKYCRYAANVCAREWAPKIYIFRIMLIYTHHPSFHTSLILYVVLNKVLFSGYKDILIVRPQFVYHILPWLFYHPGCPCPNLSYTLQAPLPNIPHPKEGISPTL